MGYIHGTERSEQERLAALNMLTNPPFLDYLAIPAGVRVLDVGSGLGILAAKVASIAGATVGIEFSEEQLSHSDGAAFFYWTRAAGVKPHSGAEETT
jgi:cyclopropane fatty-acyl-phospholipid synthase-like methyltransferase